jgi:hypothetical protein
MIYYLICFASSLFLLWFGQKLKHGQCELLRWVIYGIALLIPATLAGVRDWSVGADIMHYAYPIFKEAGIVPNIGAFNAGYDNWIGIGYLWLNILMSRITDNFNMVLFIIMFIEIVFVFLTIYQWRNKFPIWLGMLVFYTFFFNLALSATRQSLALSIAFCGIKFLFERKFLFFAFWVYLGSLFHSSIIIILAYYPLFLYANKYASKKSTLLLSLILLLLIIFSNEILAYFLTLMSDIIPRADIIVKHYLDSTNGENSGYKTFVYFAFLPILFLYKRRTILEQFRDIGHFLEITIMLVAAAQLLVFIIGEPSYRFVTISNWWLHFLIPITFYSYNKTLPKIVVNVMVLSYCFFYFYYFYFRVNPFATGHYSSSILSNIF